MKLEYIEVGQIVNTHGVRGEMKLNCRDVAPELLRRCKTFYIDGKAAPVSSSRVHKGCLLFTLPGVNDMDAALAYKTRVVSVRRADLSLEDGFYFPAELEGMTVLDAADGRMLGKLKEVIAYPGHDIYVVRGEKEFMVPAVPAFIAAIDPEANTLSIHVWEGLI